MFGSIITVLVFAVLTEDHGTALTVKINSIHIMVHNHSYLLMTVYIARLLVYVILTVVVNCSM